MSEPTRTGLHRLAQLTAGATFALLFVGGLVTSTGSGLAVPDWPLSFGQVFPRMEGGVLFEHGHRLFAAAVGVLTVCLALWTVVSEIRPGVRALALLALFSVVLQGVLGGATVLYRLPLGVSVAHACLAEAFLCLTVALAVVTGRDWAHPRAGVRAASPGVALAAAVATGIVFAQIALGAVVRHMGAGLAIPDFPLAFGMIVPPLVTPLITLHFAHRVGALVVAFIVLALAATVVRRHGDDAGLRRPAQFAAALVIVQIALGALTIWSRRAVLPTTLHLSGGAAVLATCLVLALRARRRVAAGTSAVRTGELPEGALA